MKKTAATACFLTLASIMTTTILTTTDSPWTDALLYTQGIVAVGAAVAAAMRIAAKEKPCATLADIIMAVWLAYATLRTYIDSGCPAAGKQLATYATLAGVYALVRLMPKPNGSTPTVASTATTLLLAATAYEMLLGLWQIYSGTSHHGLFPATGSMFNPGPYSAYIATGTVVAIGRLHGASDADWHRGRRATQLWLCTAIAMAGCFIIAVTRSRSAMVAVAAATAWTFRSEMKRKYAIPAVIAAAAAAAGLFFLKAESAMGRIVIWRQAAAMVADSPLFGSGLGSFAGEYGKHLAIFFASSDNVVPFAKYADVADYAFCDILQTAAEQGITGCLLCLAFAALSLRSLSRHSPLLATAFATLLLFSLFSYPMQLLPLQTIAVCLAAVGQTGERGIATGCRRTATLCATLCAIAAVGCRAIALPHVKARAEYAKVKGMTHSTFIYDYYRLLPVCGDDKHFLFDFAHLLQANHRHLDACAMLRRGTLVSGDPMFWVLMGNSQREMRHYQQAAACYDRAFAILPNRLYPLYQKMQMYRDTGNAEQARAAARRLLGTKPKIESGATRRNR